MMRAVEFASRLGFAITPDAYEAILAHRKEIAKSAPPRVTEELSQSLKGGHALPTFLLLREVGLLDVLLPELARVLREIDPDHPHGTGHLFWALLDVLDAERRRGRSFEDAALFAILMLADRALPGPRDDSRRRAHSRPARHADRGNRRPDRAPDDAPPRPDPPDPAGPDARRPPLPPARRPDRDPAPRLPGGLLGRARSLRALRHGDRPRGGPRPGVARPPGPGPPGRGRLGRQRTCPTSPAAGPGPPGSAAGAAGGGAGRSPSCLPASSPPVNFCPAVASRGVRRC